jgi:hypothetical protein
MKSEHGVEAFIGMIIVWLLFWLGGFALGAYRVVTYSMAGDVSSTVASAVLAMVSAIIFVGSLALILSEESRPE